jgi:hypothetical protein
VDDCTFSVLSWCHVVATLCSNRAIKKCLRPVTCDLRLGLRVVDLVGDEQSYLLHCLNTAGHNIQCDTCLAEKN